ncbi:MAG: hypothetical protein PVI66_13805 [Candidatus Aminicenantes bacterium]
MKKSYLLILAVFCLSLCAIQCSRDSSPVGPELSGGNLYEGAVLVGNFVATGNNTIDFRMIQVSIKNTNVRAYPDVNGDFRLEGVPTGNQSLEVNVDNHISHIDVADIQSGEQIRMQLQIQENNSVMLQHMNRDKKHSEDLEVEIRPKKWNIDWVNSVDEGHARIYGAGFDTITSVVITGPTGIGIQVTRTDKGGVYFKAFFNQSAAIAAIPNPTRGDSHEITVTITYSEGTVDKPFEIEIVGQGPDEPEEDLGMDIDPHKWNTNWITSNGYVTVRFRGEGFDTIVPGATVMSYNGGIPIEPSSDGIHGSSYMAKFTKKDAIGLFTEPKKGETYQVDVMVQFDDSSTRTFPHEIQIVGPNK